MIFNHPFYRVSYVVVCSTFFVVSEKLTRSELVRLLKVGCQVHIGHYPLYFVKSAFYTGHRKLQTSYSAAYSKKNTFICHKRMKSHGFYPYIFNSVCINVLYVFTYGRCTILMVQIHATFCNLKLRLLFLYGENGFSIYLYPNDFFYQELKPFIIHGS